MSDNTKQEDLGSILMQRLFPRYGNGLKFEKDQLFEGSPAINFKMKELKINGRSMQILDRNSAEGIKGLKAACIKALNQEKPEGEQGDAQMHNLGFWCAIPTIRDVLERNNFKFPEKDQEWKEILDGGWVKNRAYHSKQSLFTPNTMKLLNEHNSLPYRIRSLRDRCAWTLKKKFKRTNFPAPGTFLEVQRGMAADEFQEAALFCTRPITAEKYVIEVLKGEIKGKVGGEQTKDYCYVRRKDINYYKRIKTTDPMEGKGF